MKIKVKKSTVLLIFAGLILIFAGLLIKSAFGGLVSGKGRIYMDGAQALERLKETAGESRLIRLADISAARKAEEPLKYLVENSEFQLDGDAIDKRVREMLIGAETTADALGEEAESLIQEQWGYDGVEAYQEIQRDRYRDFIQKRLTVYHTAMERKITIDEKDYQRLLPAYSEKFGYEHEDILEAECDEDSLACEMLYDKVISYLYQ